jgi:hypothetical protein
MQSRIQLIFVMLTTCVLALAGSACLDTKADPGYCPPSDWPCPWDLVDAGKDASATRQDGAVPSDGSVRTDSAMHDGSMLDASDANMLDASALDASDASDLDASEGDASEGDPDAGPCGMTCPSNAPVCDTGAGQCVQCTGNKHCKAGSKNVCDTDDHECVQCLDKGDCDGDDVCSADHACVQCTENDHCTDPAASVCGGETCEACQQDADCDHIAGKGVCDTGECVQCTGAKYAACGNDEDDKPLVCDSASRTCSTSATERSTGLCGGCVSDAQCNLGQLCVMQTFDSATIGYFCVWQKAAGVGGAPTGCSTARPFVKTVNDAESIDGTTANICTLAVTTCPAYNDYRSSAVNCEPTPNVPDDSACGAPSVDDAYCRLFDMDGADNIYRCTMPCLSDDDCKVGATCDTEVAPNVCTL